MCSVTDTRLLPSVIAPGTACGHRLGRGMMEQPPHLVKRMIQLSEPVELCQGQLLPPQTPMNLVGIDWERCFLYGSGMSAVQSDGAQ